MPRSKTTAQRTHKNKSDRLFSLLIRSHGRCEREGAKHSSQLQCAHWIGRRYAWTRTDPRNAFCLCAKCHRHFTDRPTEFSDWAISMRGRLTYQFIRERSLRRDKFDWIDEFARLEKRPHDPVIGEPTLVQRDGIMDGWRSPEWLQRRLGRPMDIESVGWTWYLGQKVTLWLPE